MLNLHLYKLATIQYTLAECVSCVLACRWNAEEQDGDRVRHLWPEFHLDQ